MEVVEVMHEKALRMKAKSYHLTLFHSFPGLIIILQVVFIIDEDSHQLLCLSKHVIFGITYVMKGVGQLAIRMFEAHGCLYGDRQHGQRRKMVELLCKYNMNVLL